MNPKVYQVEHDGKFITVKSHNSPLGVVRALFRLAERYTPWEDKGNGVTLIKSSIGDILVKEIDIPLAWIKWGPA